MAKAKFDPGASKRKSARKKRPGIHAKTKTSKSKNGDLYKKRYVGQGK